MSTQPDVPSTAPTRWRTALNWTDKVLLTIGVLVVMAAVFLMHTFSGKLILVTLGILIIEAGIGRLLYRHLARQRQYLGLRKEVDHFLTYVRQLNTAAVMLKTHDTPETRHAVEHMRKTMHASVERMTVLAGKTDIENAGAVDTDAAMECLAVPVPRDTPDV